ncbi:MAG: UDP-N-acetylmuramoyl-L-alanyl-D-glutamate--2,6-diaminopimelate ligase [Solirubrobacteraceae bacterium]|nr:UDP-N-acetylmuramoyl-L-alanyl-D-glutamate--2,6-diaminopimelate ligase [Solirubrobacteraceae bacterium]
MASLADLADLGHLARGEAGPALGFARIDSRAVQPGDLFCAIPGFTADGHDFAAGAVERGAAALLVERELPLDVPQLVVADARAATAQAAARLAGDPTARLQTVGITGTNGKTTSTYLTRHLLQTAGRPTGLIGTVEQIVGGVRQEGGRTTPEAPDLQGMFAAMLDAGDEACVMEVSSHAMTLHRADAIRWAAVAFTNLSRDHLDFHPTMEEYFAAKRELIAAAPQVAVVDLDDEYGARLAGEFPDALTVSIDAPGARLKATDLDADASGTSFTVGGYRTRVPLPGLFNVRNALTALGLAVQLGIDLAAAAAALPAAPVAPGRMETIDEGQPFAVFVDYAHTPDALERVLASARALTSGRVLCVFGCGGDRDRGKRPEMGHAVDEGADIVIVTSDNPRSEEPQAIIDDVLAGISGPSTAIVDRREAIAFALGEAQPGDVVVIAGKGHEQGQTIAGVTHPFDDAQVARDVLGPAVAR